MKHYHKKRLLKLADLLEKDAANKKGLKFDLSVVGAPAGWEELYHAGEYAAPPNYTPGLSCGTVGCAMGLASISGVFKRSGLTYQIEAICGQITNVVDGVPLSYTSAAQEFFGLFYEEANYLFNPESYPDSKTKGARAEREVAKRIRKLVAQQ